MNRLDGEEFASRLKGDPKDLFPHMPAEVFNFWIKPQIGRLGWPFSSENLSLSGTPWDGFFGDNPLSFWMNAKWTLLNFTLREHLLTEETNTRIWWIIGACARGEQTPTANLENTIERFWACAAFIRETNKLPFPVIGISTGGRGIDIIDGHHRLAALVHLDRADGFDLTIWMAN